MVNIVVVVVVVVVNLTVFAHSDATIVDNARMLFFHLKSYY